MARLKNCKSYFFSVEGETEQWYLKWLQNLINGSESATHKITIRCDVQKDPVKYAKKLNILGETTIYHLSDYESDELVHVQQFATTIDRMKKASQDKQITYKFGYTNLTFDLWIILHMMDCNGSITHRKNYITPLNCAYGENFENMDEYKHEKNFKRCLGKLQLSNVILAVNRAKAIMQRNHENGYVQQEYKKYKYYRENPSLAIGEAIEVLLTECGLM